MSVAARTRATSSSGVSPFIWTVSYLDRIALRASPVRAPDLETGDHGRQELLDRDSDLGGGVAVSECDGVVLERVEVNGDTKGGADLVLASITAADRLRVVVVARAVPRAADARHLPARAGASSSFFESGRIATW